MEKKKVTYCVEKGRLAPCHFAKYDRLFDLGIIRCAKCEACSNQRVKTEDALRKIYEKEIGVN